MQVRNFLIRGHFEDQVADGNMIIKWMQGNRSLFLVIAYKFLVYFRNNLDVECSMFSYNGHQSEATRCCYAWYHRSLHFCFIEVTCSLNANTLPERRPIHYWKIFWHFCAIMLISLHWVVSVWRPMTRAIYLLAFQLEKIYWSDLGKSQREQLRVWKQRSDCLRWTYPVVVSTSTYSARALLGSNLGSYLWGLGWRAIILSLRGVGETKQGTESSVLSHSSSSSARTGWLRAHCDVHKLNWPSMLCWIYLSERI